MQKFKNYMLPVAMISGAIFHNWLVEWAFLMPWLLFFMLLFSFIRIGPEDVTFTKLHIWLLAVQLIGSLLLYWGLLWWNPVIAQSAFMCVFMPTATAAAVITGLLGGNVGFLTSFVLSSNVLVSVTAPMLFSYMGNNNDLPFWDSVWSINMKVLPILIFPLILAWLIRWWTPKLRLWMTKLSQIPFYLWAVSLTIVTGRTVSFLVAQENPNYFLESSIALLALLICGVHFWIGRTLGGRYGDKISGGQALMQKNTILAIWMAQMYLHPVASVGPAAYILWQNVLNSYQLWKKGKKS